MKKTNKVTTMDSPSLHNDGDMPDEIDFSKGERGKFCRKNAQLQWPLYREASVQVSSQKC